MTKSGRYTSGQTVSLHSGSMTMLCPTRNPLSRRVILRVG
jgi:hypothetical protein